MRDSLLYAKPGEPSLVVQLHASKQLAQEQCQVLTQENRALTEANRELKDKVRKWIHSGRCASLIEVTQLVDWQLVYRSAFTRECTALSRVTRCRAGFLACQVIRFQDILKDADSEIGDLNSKKLQLQEELAKEEAEEQKKLALQTHVAQVRAGPAVVHSIAHRLIHLYH